MNRLLILLSALLVTACDPAGLAAIRCEEAKTDFHEQIEVNAACSQTEGCVLDTDDMRAALYLLRKAREQCEGVPHG